MIPQQIGRRGRNAVIADPVGDRRAVDNLRRLHHVGMVADNGVGAVVREQTDKITGQPAGRPIELTAAMQTDNDKISALFCLRQLLQKPPLIRRVQLILVKMIHTDGIIRHSKRLFQADPRLLIHHPGEGGGHRAAALPCPLSFIGLKVERLRFQQPHPQDVLVIQ